MSDTSWQESAVFDVFVSHNSQDKRTVHHIARQLKERGLRVWLDAWELVPGRPILGAIEQAITHCRAVAVLVGEHGLGPWERSEMHAALAEHVKRQAPVIPVLLPGAIDSSTLPFFLKAFAAVDFREGICDAELNRLEWGIMGSKPDGEHVVEPPWARHVSARQSRTGIATRIASTDSKSHHVGSSEYDPIGIELHKAVERRATLLSAGGDTSVVDAEILQLKRKLREGGQLKPGDVLRHQERERYVLLNHLGQGGFATVWRARDRSTDQLVAVKVLHGAHAQDRSRRTRFFRGARAMAALRHEAVVRVLVPHAEDGGFHFFVMEYLDGGDLHHAIVGKRLPMDQLVPLIVALGRGLVVAHRQGLVHRDIKPANVLLDATNNPKLTDFDLVRSVDTTGGTRTGAMGTFIYAAPELLSRPQDADVRADVYGLGMTTLFMLRGERLPFDVLRNAEHVITQLDCDNAIKQVISHAVAWAPEDRYVSVQEYCDALQAAAEKQDAHDGPYSAKDSAVCASDEWHSASPPAPASSSTTSATPKGSAIRIPHQLRRWPWIIAILIIAGLVGKLSSDSPSTSTAGPVAAPSPDPPSTRGAPVAKCPKTMVLIPGGTFMMGSSDGESDEKPPHQVEVRSFCLDITEVTVADYMACKTCKPAAENEGCNTGTAGREQHPINCVDWNRASHYCSKKTEGGRLPSEEEWAYAARGTRGRRHPWGNAPPSLQLLNACGIECPVPRRLHQQDDGWPTTAPIGSFPQGKTPDTGLLDMAGNVWEWTASGYSSNYDAERTPAAYVIRGGSWRSGSTWDLRSARRLRHAPLADFNDVGFRCAVSQRE